MTYHFQKDMRNKSSYGNMGIVSKGELESDPCSTEKLSGGFTVTDAKGELDSLRSVRLIEL